jgi:hypothetical protein
LLADASARFGEVGNRLDIKKPPFAKPGQGTSGIVFPAACIQPNECTVHTPWDVKLS